MYNALKVSDPRLTTLHVSRLQRNGRSVSSAAVTLGKVFFFSEVKYTGKVIWDLCEKSLLPVKAKANAKLDTQTGHKHFLRGAAARRDLP